MTITFTNTQKRKARNKAMRDAYISNGMQNVTRTIVYKNKKRYDRKRDKKVVMDY